MEFLERVFLSFLQSSLTASVVILIVISILKILKNHLSIRVKNALWILVLIKLLIPVTPETNTNLFNILYEKYGHNFQSQNDANDFIEVNKTLEVSEENYNNISQNNADYSNTQISANNKIQDNSNKNLISNVFKIVASIWLIGVLLLSLVVLLYVFNIKRKTKCLENHVATGVLNLFKECRLKVNIKSRIPVYVYEGFKSPCIVGIIKPKIYIPKYVLSIEDNNQLSHVFLHELVHCKRKDLVYNFLGIIALIIHWFNPLVWLAVKKMKLYREYACDACVLELLNEEEKIEYGMTLLSLSKMLLNKGNYSQIPVFFETNTQIKDRIWMIKGFKKGSYKMTTRAVLGCTIATIIILTNNLAVKGLEADNIIPIAVNDIEELKENYKSNANEVNTMENYDTDNIKESDQNVVSTNDLSNDTNSKGKWVQDKGKWYYYNRDGVVQKNITVDGYKLGVDGALIDDKASDKTEKEVDKGTVTKKTNDATNKVSTVNETASANVGITQSDAGQEQILNPPTNSDGRPVQAVTNNTSQSSVDSHINTDKYKESNKTWKKDGQNWTYPQKDGTKTTGWVKVNDNWYHLDKNGVMDKNTTVTEGGKTYDLSEDGTLKDIKGR